VELIPEYVDAAKYIREADVVLMPSYDEGLGTTMLEALACGVPVVANSQEPAYCQWIEHGRNGFLRELEVGKWVQGIKEALEIPRGNMLETARRIREEASHETINKSAYEKFYQLVQEGK
jgi:glycosyltransferase involved in cell wall biosynthesis